MDCVCGLKFVFRSNYSKSRYIEPLAHIPRRRHRPALRVAASGVGLAVAVCGLGLRFAVWVPKQLFQKQRTEDAQGPPTQSHISPSISVYEDEADQMSFDKPPSGWLQGGVGLFFRGLRCRLSDSNLILMIVLPAFCAVSGVISRYDAATARPAYSTSSPRGKTAPRVGGTASDGGGRTCAGE